MDKVFKVKKSFIDLVEPEDIIEYDKDTNTYFIEKIRKSSYVQEGIPYNITSQTYIDITPGEVETLIKEGYLVSVEQDKPHVNVFDRIKELSSIYSKELKTLDEDMTNAPACLKIERQTVLQNLLTVLQELASYKY